MKEKGVTSALFSLGGNIQTIGTKTDGTDWFIGIRAAEENRYLGGVFVKDKAVVTSGGYERYFAGDDGQIYWHIHGSKNRSSGQKRSGIRDYYQRQRFSV